MPNRPFSAARGLVARFTRLDECGTPQSGPCGTVVTKGFISVAAAPNILQGEEVQQRLADGSFCVNDRDAPVLSRFDLTEQFCVAEPEAFELTTGSPIWPNHDGSDSIGFTEGEDPHEQVYALEVWQAVKGTNACGGDPDCGPLAHQQWVYHLFPRVVNGIISGTATINSGLITWEMTAETRGNPNWGVGPYDVECSDGLDPCTPGPLNAALASDVHRLVTLTGIAPPDPDALCGCQTLP